MSIATVLRAFGFDDGVTLEREFTTEEGLPKAIVSVAPRGRLFVGSTDRAWPSPDHLNWLLPRLNDVGHWLAALCDDVMFGPYLRAVSGDHVVRDGACHRFVTTAFTGREARPLVDGRHLARGLGLFHRAAARSLLVDPAPRSRRGSAGGLLKHFTLPTLSRAIKRGLPDLDGRLRGAREVTERISHRSARALDGLPVVYIHDDFQPKNVLLDERSDGRTMIRIIDAEQGSVQTRLHDLYFLYMGDDHGAALGDLSHFEDGMRAYQRLAGSLSDDERRLLPDALQFKAANVVAWACGQYPEVSPMRKVVLAAYLRSALDCIDHVERHRSEIQEIVRAAAG
jgi:Ser/Thr protein kinase RdoA (MazF antagonist)